MGGAALRVVVCDDAIDARALTTASARSSHPLQCIQVGDSEELYQAIEQYAPDGVVVAYSADAGGERLRALTQRYAGPLLAIGPVADEQQARAAGASDYLARDEHTLSSLPHVVRSLVLARQVDELQEFRDQFISVASHELKNPLAALRGYAELLLRRLQRAEGDERMLKGLITILQQSVRMQHILDDLHDLSRISRGLLQLQSDLVNVDELLQHVVEGAQYNDRAVPVELLTSNVSLFVYGDVERLQQVLCRLLDIAAMHSPQETAVHVAAVAEPDAVLGRVRIELRSQGGIMTREIEQAFAHFYNPGNASRINASERLSAFVCAALVRMHNGEIWFERANGGESIFHIALPLAQGPS
jgi:signal transduction histidine kinase